MIIDADSLGTVITATGTAVVVIVTAVIGALRQIMKGQPARFAEALTAEDAEHDASTLRLIVRQELAGIRSEQRKLRKAIRAIRAMQDALVADADIAQPRLDELSARVREIEIENSDVHDIITDPAARDRSKEPTAPGPSAGRSGRHHAPRLMSILLLLGIAASILLGLRESAGGLGG